MTVWSKASLQCIFTPTRQTVNNKKIRKHVSSELPTDEYHDSAVEIKQSPHFEETLSEQESSDFYEHSTSDPDISPNEDNRAALEEHSTHDAHNTASKRPTRKPSLSDLDRNLNKNLNSKTGRPTEGSTATLPHFHSLDTQHHPPHPLPPNHDGSRSTASIPH